MDKVINCVDCGNQFTFTEGEQQYYMDKGLNVPKRCPACRLKRTTRIKASPELPESIESDEKREEFRKNIDQLENAQ